MANVQLEMKEVKKAIQQYMLDNYGMKVEPDDIEFEFYNEGSFHSHFRKSDNFYVLINLKSKQAG